VKVLPLLIVPVHTRENTKYITRALRELTSISPSKGTSKAQSVVGESTRKVCLNNISGEGIGVDNTK